MNNICLGELDAELGAFVHDRIPQLGSRLTPQELEPSGQPYAWEVQALGGFGVSEISMLINCTGENGWNFSN